MADILKTLTRARDNFDAAVAAAQAGDCAEASRQWNAGVRRSRVGERVVRVYHADSIQWRKDNKLPAPESSVKSGVILPGSAVHQMANAVYNRHVNLTMQPPRALAACNLPVGRNSPEFKPRRKRRPR